jgi:succinate dehydrogenase/fumarate reductase flavoprotein subunit
MSNEVDSLDVIIIGGGIAGLTADWKGSNLV